MGMDIELTNEAFAKIAERCRESDSEKDIVRIDLVDSGCAGYEYDIRFSDNINNDDTVIDYGKFSIVVSEKSKPFLQGTTLDYVKEGLNETLKFINPNEVSSCGCGVSVQF